MHSKILSALVLAVTFLITSNGYSGVTLDYPGFFSDDTNVPGIPSKDIDEYKEELEEWADIAGIDLLDSSLNYVSSSLDIGFTDDVGVTVDGTKEILFSRDYPVSDQMRDILFLESLKESVEKWDEYCVKQIGGTTGLSLSDAYGRAFDIYSRYREFTVESGFSTTIHANPIVSAILGAGNTSYGNLLKSDGLLEDAVEGKIIAFGSKIASNENLLDALQFSKLDMASYAFNFAGSLFKSTNILENDTAILWDNLATGGFALVQGGTSLAFAPAKMLYKTSEYIYTQLHTSAQGAHLINLYYFSKHYPDHQNEYLDSSTGEFMDFLSFQTDGDTICSSLEISNDNIAKALCNFNYGGFFSKDNCTADEKRTAYAIASLFNLVEGLDIRTMKKEIVARVKLEELKEHSFVLFSSHLGTNQYTIRLPDYVQNDSEHGGVPTSITYTINDENIQTVYPDAVSNEVAISGTELIKELVFDLSAYESTKEDQTLKATIVYSDGYTIFSAVHLTFYPQIDSLELVDLPDPLFSTDMEMSVKFCGDESYYARLFYKRSDTEDWDAQFFHLSGAEDLGGNCRKFKITVDGDDIYRKTGYVPVDFKVKVEAVVSPTYTKNMVNPDDLDADLLSDAWENLYFGSLDELAGGDFDNDGETNYQEWLHGTDPTKAGVEGVIRSWTFSPVENSSGDWKYDFSLSGTYGCD
jgi:hypothetical protein